LVLLHTVEFFVVAGVISFILAQELFVIAGAFNVFDTAVINLNRVPIKDLVILMMVWKVLVDQLKKTATDFCCYIFIKWWIKPNDFAILLLVVVFPMVGFYDSVVSYPESFSAFSYGVFAWLNIVSFGLSFP